MWEKKIEEIRKIEERYGGRLNEPASNHEINKMQENISVKYNGFILPIEYNDFLKELNGLEFNGLILYGVDKTFFDKEIEEDVQGFIEANEIWHENKWQKQYIFFADSDTAWYCYDLNGRGFLELDKPSGTVMNSFSNFEAMLEEALSTRLD